MIGPLSLSLEPADDRVVPERLFAVPDSSEARIACHQVSGDQGHLDNSFPISILLRPALLKLRGIVILPLFTVRLYPRHRFRKLLRVVYCVVHSSSELTHINRLYAHSEVTLKKRMINDRSGNSHRDAAHRQVRLAAHRCDGEPSLNKLKDFFLHINRDRGVAGILHIPPVDAKRGESFLVVGGECCSEIDGSGALGPVESPNRLWKEGIHVHGLGPITPARCNGQ